MSVAVEYELPKIVSKLLRANEGGYVNRKVQSIIQVAAFTMIPP